MNKLNITYKVSPKHFLNNYALTMNPSIVGAVRDPRELMAGLQHFDIRPLPYPGGAELKFFMDAGQGQHIGDRQVGRGARLGPRGMGPTILQAIGVIWRPAPDVKPEPREPPIHAYWLPYEADKTHELVLGNAANYFFTAGLSGCCVMVSGNPRAPRVAHINRTETGSATFNSVIGNRLQAEDKLAKQRARVQGLKFVSRTDKEAKTNRQIMFQELKSKADAFATGRDTSNDLFGYCKWGEQYSDLCGVIGLRNQGTGVWEFYYQRYRNAPAPRELANLGFIMQRDGGLQRLV